MYRLAFPFAGGGETEDVGDGGAGIKDSDGRLNLVGRLGGRAGEDPGDDHVLVAIGAVGLTVAAVIALEKDGGIGGGV